MLKRFCVSSFAQAPGRSQVRQCVSSTMPKSTVATGDVEADMYLLGCSSSRNPLKRLFVGPMGRLVLNGNPTLAILFFSGVGWGLSDYLSQKWEMEAAIGWANEAIQQKERRNAERAAKGLPPLPPNPHDTVTVDLVNPYQVAVAALFGAVVMGLGGRYWYPAMDGFVRRLLPNASPFNRTAGKLSLEFCFWYPLTLISYWGLMGGLVYSQPVGDILTEGVSQQLVPTVVSEAPLWIPAQFVNFRCLPVQLHVFFVCCVAFVENATMGFLKAEAMSDEEFQRERMLERQQQH